jgi:protein-tyrosine-phosphatase
MAKAFYNRITNSHDAEAAGTNVKEPDQTLQERKDTGSSHNFFVLDVMQEKGIDLSQAKRLQLTEAMLAHYDLVVSMARKDESPSWLLTSPRYIYWDIKDPRGQNLVVTAKVRDQIEIKVNALLK